MTINQAAAANLLNLILHGTEWPGIARNDASPLASLWLALHTADPTPTGLQTTNEVTYLGYARIAVPRSSAGWATAVANVATLLNQTAFPPGSGGFSIATFLSVGTQQVGAGEVILSGPLSSPIVCGNNATPLIQNTTEILLQ